MTGSDLTKVDSNHKLKAKHVSQACLECRSKHVKCTGEIPKCARCVKAGGSCTYVKSNRGGARQKGVKKQKVISKIITENEIEDMGSLPCIVGLSKDLPKSECVKTCANPKASCLFEAEPFNMLDYETYSDPRISEIVNSYYDNFHDAHPFLPPKLEFYTFFNNLTFNHELISAMEIISEGQSIENFYNKDIGKIEKKILKIIKYIDNFDNDLVTLQTYFLISMICHISSLHDLSSQIRNRGIFLLTDLKLHLVDYNDLPENYIDINGHVDCSSIDNVRVPVLNSSRFKDLDKATIKDCARRIFWEFYFFDIIIGTASGITTSKLCDLSIYLKFPLVPAKDVFNYEIRSHLSKVVNDSIKLNIAINSRSPYNLLLLKINAALGNWELVLANPKLFNEPYLVNNSGTVNNGIHQAIMMYCYAKIYTHRPFSYIFKPDILPQQPKCCGENESESSEDKVSVKIVNFDSRKIIETRKTIDAANRIVESLIDTNPSTIKKRTPLIACSLAFAGLVHLSSYFWIESKFNQTEKTKDIIKKDELKIIEEYLKLELSGIYAISNHWQLSQKLGCHIKETTKRVLPKLYDRIRNFLPKEIEPRNIEIEDITHDNVNQNVIQSGMNRDDLNINNEMNMNLNDIPETGCDWIDKSGFLDTFDFLEGEPFETDYTFRY